mmetsp:Transcript_5320/g.21466  ORF Transcript_5320/g.21466 Transcript_5320/m.21466 type:complete len:304 (-) Transcript_5320:1023-1934(-)
MDVVAASTSTSSPTASRGNAAATTLASSRIKWTISCARWLLSTSSELRLRSTRRDAFSDKPGAPPLAVACAASLAHAVIVCAASARASGCVSAASHSMSITSRFDFPVNSPPYSPSVQTITSSRAFGSFGFRSSSAYARAASARSDASASSSPLPSPMSRIRLFIARGLTTSPPMANTSFMVLMNHFVEGAYRSASVPILVTVSSRRCASCASARNASIFSTITSTLWLLVIAYIRSRVFLRRLSSGSVRQSTTAIWCSAACAGLTFTMPDSDSRPTYFRLLDGDETNRLTAAAQCSSNAALG